MSMTQLFPSQLRLVFFRGCAVGFATVVFVLTLRSFPEHKSPPSDFASREDDVRAALAMHSGRVSDKVAIRNSAFSKLPVNPEMIKLPALFVNQNGEHCFAIGVASSEDGDPLLVRCVDRKGAIIRRSWSELTRDATGMLPLQTGRRATATIGKGEVQLSWLVWDFGTTKSDRAYTADFRLLNSGSVPVVIRQVSQSCTCVETRHKHDLPMSVAVGEAVDFAFVVEQVTQIELSLQATVEVDCEGASEKLPLRIFGTGAQSSALPVPVPENVADEPSAVTLQRHKRGSSLSLGKTGDCLSKAVVQIARSDVPFAYELRPGRANGADGADWTKVFSLRPAAHPQRQVF